MDSGEGAAPVRPPPRQSMALSRLPARCFLPACAGTCFLGMGFAWLTGIRDPAECCGEGAARKPDGCAGFEVRGRSNTRGSTFACVLRNSSQLARTRRAACGRPRRARPQPPT